MMRLPPFTYLAPHGLEEAARMLAEHGPGAMVVAGGTDLFPNMKRRQQEPAVVIGLRAVPELRALAVGDDGWTRVGAMTTLERTAADPLVRERYPALATAARLVSTPHLRSMGTLGGNLCLDTRCNYYDQSYHWRRSVDFCMKKDGAICWVAPGSPRCWAVSSSDTAPVAVALGARFRLVSASGERVVDAADYFRDDGIAYLTRRPDEILTEVLLPPGDGVISRYWKLRRRGSFDFPILGVAVALRRDDQVVRDVRIVLGAVGSSPVLATQAAALLEGQRPDPRLLEEAASRAWKGARPLDNTDLNYAWRKRMARVYVRRALRDAVGLPPVDARTELPMAPGG
jgi:4-hydroxybenzoyl-CoA reductase subunit beta